MSPETPPPSLHFLLAFLYLLSFSLLPCSSTSKDDRIQGMFVFGSSLVDTGNNNFLKTTTKADFLPYGIDFPGGPSGRFSNGKNVVDFIGDHLRLPPLPPFSSPSTKAAAIVHGVDFASGGSGILNDTGSFTGEVTSLTQQIKNFEEVTLPDLEAQLGLKSSESLSNYLFVLGVGGNDISFNYFIGAINQNITFQFFAETMTSQLSDQVKKLYSLGGRRFVFMSVNPLGSTPMASKLPNKVYAKLLNQASRVFNFRLKSLVDGMKTEMPGSQLVLVNAYEIIRSIMKSPDNKGFKNTTSPCCEMTSNEIGSILCKRGGTTCENRSSYVFFDSLHPTEAANEIIASTAYYSNSAKLVYPTNIRLLADLDLDLSVLDWHPVLEP